MSAATQQQPREIKPKPKAYAFERSLGIPPAEACRRAGGKVENGHATKWEHSGRVQAWIKYYRSLGQDDEMVAAKRARIEERLAIAAFGNIFDFTEMVERVVLVAGKGDKLDREVKTKAPLIDWDAVKASELAPIISSFKFDKDTGELVHFERDDALAALAQLRDMHGFKAPARTELSGRGGAPLFDLSKLTDEQLAALESIAAAAGSAAPA